MVQRMHVVLEDDLDGGEAVETVTFGLDGTTYEIDLSDANAAALRDQMGRYVSAGRRTGGRRSPGPSSNGRGPARVDKEQLRKMREWARENGYEVSDKGRISQEIQDAFSARADKGARRGK